MDKMIFCCFREDIKCINLSGHRCVGLWVYVCDVEISDLIFAGYKTWLVVWFEKKKNMREKKYYQSISLISLSYSSSNSTVYFDRFSHVVVNLWCWWCLLLFLLFAHNYLIFLTHFNSENQKYTYRSLELIEIWGQCESEW